MARVACVGSSQNAPLFLGTASFLAFALLGIGITGLVLKTYGHVNALTNLGTTGSSTLIGVGGLSALITLGALSCCGRKKTIGHQPVVHAVIPHKANQAAAQLRFNIAYAIDPNKSFEMSSLSMLSQEPNSEDQQLKKSLASGEMTLTTQESRAVGIMLGMAVGDARGLPYRNLYYKKEGYDPSKLPKTKLPTGAWGDATSQGLCLADTFLFYGNLDQIQMMHALYDWDLFHYNAPLDDGNKHRLLLDEATRRAIEQFMDRKIRRDARGNFEAVGQYFYQDGNENNATLMRNGPVAIFAQNLEEAVQLAKKQSKTTHCNEIPEKACALMTTILYTALHDPSPYSQNRKKNALASIEKDWGNPSINQFVKRERIANQIYPERNIDWRWNQADWDYVQGHSGQDTLATFAMALHCIENTNNFSEALNMAIKRGGQSNRVGAIVGQIAGAIYGVEDIPRSYITQVQLHDREGEIAFKAYKLCHIPHSYLI